jgi:hypothetical protein
MAHLMMAAGCGSSDPLGTVSGKVLFDGQPVGEGTVILDNLSGVSAQAVIGSDGSYQVTTIDGGLPPGDYSVMILPPEIPDPSSGENTAPGTITKEMPNIPEQYRSFEATPLKITIQEGENQINLEMSE